MNDGHCPKCGGLFVLVSSDIIQRWACHNCHKIVFRPYNQNEIYQTYDEADVAMRGKK